MYVVCNILSNMLRQGIGHRVKAIIDLCNALQTVCDELFALYAVLSRSSRILTHLWIVWGLGNVGPGV